MSGIFLIGVMSTYMLSYFSGLEAVAIYTLGSRFAYICVVVLILPFQLAYQPFIFSYLDKPDIKKTISRIFTYLLLAITYLSIFILIGSKILSMEETK